MRKYNGRQKGAKGSSFILPPRAILVSIVFEHFAAWLRMIEDDQSDAEIFVVAIDQYAYLVPYVETESEIFLKTVIPSRKFTRLYLRGDS